MIRINWRDLLERLGILALIASIVFVGLQLRQDKQIAAAQVYVESDGLVFELSQMVNESRDVWFRGLNGEKLSELEEITFRAIAGAVYRRHAGISQRVSILRTSVQGARANLYAYILYQYPSLRRVFMDRVKFDEMRRVANEVADLRFGQNNFDQDVLKFLAEFDRLAPPLHEKTYILF